MNKFGKFPYLVIPLKELLIQQLNSSENHEHDLNDMISNLHGKLLMQSWAFKLITPYYRSRLHLNENQKQIELELLQFIKPYVLRSIKKGKKECLIQ
jgi:hypothetical protein